MDNRYPTTDFNNAEIVAKIDTPVLQELISKRSGRGNTTLSYLRGDIIADQLNNIFGPLGWDLQAAVPVIDHWEGEKEVGYQNDKKMVNMHTVQVMTQMTLRIKARSAEDSDTVFRQTGIGYGEIETTKNRKEVVGMALKGAETDGLKRCASLLGRAMGMFLTAAGQDEIDYAHNGKNNDIKAAKVMRDHREGENGDNNATARVEDRREARPALQDQRSSGNQNNGRSNDRQENQDTNNRQDNRRDDRRDDRQDNRGQRQQQDSRPDPAKTEAKSETTKVETQAKPTTQAKPEQGNSKPNADKGTEKDKDKGFDLDRLPVTKDEQVAYSQTLLARLEEFNQASDKEKFLKTHYNTIKNLDSKYRRRMIELLAEQKIDFEALGAK